VCSAICATIIYAPHPDGHWSWGWMIFWRAGSVSRSIQTRGRASVSRGVRSSARSVGSSRRDLDARALAGRGHPGALVIASRTVLLQALAAARHGGWGDAAGPDPTSWARGDRSPARLRVRA